MGFQKKEEGGNTNSTYLALIPKESNPSSFNHFRPISLHNSSYKIISKVLANQLKPLLPILIFKNQGAFVPNKKIIDNIMLIQEAIHSNMSRNEKTFILKLDMANAFNCVNHSFLTLVLQKLVFSSDFIALITTCINGPWISPLVNGRLGNFFQSSRGLRQGFPLSPFLFIIMEDSLSINLEHNRQNVTITGIYFSRGIKSINHSQFVDDTIFLGGASCIIAKRIKKILYRIFGGLWLPSKQ